MRVERFEGGTARLEGRGAGWTWAAAAVGVGGIVVALLLARGGEHGREELFRSYLANFAFVLSLALGGLFFVLVTHLTRAGWSVALRRVAEVVGCTLLPLSLLSVVLLFGLPDLYSWARPAAVAADELLQHKQGYLNPTFFVVRFVFYFVVWSATALYFLRRSVVQDRTGDPALTLELERAAAPAVIVYALTVTFASFDLLMSLDPHWYSTIYGVYYFSGCILGFLALLPILLILVGRQSTLRRIINREHYHDVGKLTFAFVVFWAYIAFSQYMLMWYGNLSEETVWYAARQSGSWLYISLVLLFGQFLIPFLWLMSRHPKRRRAILVAAGLWLLAMHWFDVLYLVMPEARPEGPPIRWIDLALLAGLGGLFLAGTFWILGRVNVIPVRDPRLGESMGLENA